MSQLTLAQTEAIRKQIDQLSLERERENERIRERNERFAKMMKEQEEQERTRYREKMRLKKEAEEKEKEKAKYAPAKNIEVLALLQSLNPELRAVKIETAKEIVLKRRFAMKREQRELEEIGADRPKPRVSKKEF
jgi:hypothetical protein